MLKGFVSGEEKDIKRIPMIGRNLFDSSIIEVGGLSPSTGEEVSNSTRRRSGFISVEPNTNYGLSREITSSGSYFWVIAYDENKNIVTDATISAEYSGILVYGDSLTDNQWTFITTPTTRYVRWYVTANNSYENIMLNLGSTPLPYEPYGYQEGWEVRDNQDRLIWGREDELQTATGTLPFKGYALPVKVKSLMGNAVQNGTPSPGPANPNLADPSKTVPGYQESNGSIHTPSAAEEITTDFIPFTSTLYILISGSANGDMNYAAYNANKQIIGIYNTGFTPNTVITADPQNYTGAAYLRASWTHGVNQPICITTKQTTTFIPFDPNPPGPVIPEMCGVRTGNIISEVISDKAIDASGTIYTNTNFIIISASVSQNEDYTFSLDSGLSDTTCRIHAYNGDTWIEQLKASNISSAPFTVTTPSGTTKLMISVVNGAASKRPMIVSGSTTPTSYIPYGWQIPFENHGENLFDEQYPNISDIIRYIPLYVGDGNFTMSTTTPYDLSVANLFLLSGNVDSGASTPNNGVWKNHDRTVASDNGYITIAYRQYSHTTSPANCKTMLNLGSTPKPYSPYLNATIPVYLGEVPTVRRVRKFVLTGQEGGTWVLNPSLRGGNGFYNLSIFTGYKSNSGFGYCTHYPLATATTDTIGVFFGGNINFITAFSEGIDTADKWKSYLATQYANGTPVTIWYVLATPETTISNEPLCKISTYADELTTIQVHGLSAPLYGIGDYKDTLNLSTGVVTRKVKKLVLTGNETFTKNNASATDYLYYAGRGALLPSSISQTPIMCGHLQEVVSAPTGENIGISTNNNFNVVYLNFGADVMNVQTSGNTVDGLKEYLASEYAAGHPVVIWYILSTPTTETVTVPTGMTGEIEGYLTQVSTPSPTKRSVPKWNGVEESGGTYAVTVYTPPEIPTTTGQNTLTVDSNLAPSKLEVSIHAKKIHYGFKIDKSNDDSDSAVIYTHDAVTMTPAHMDFTNDRFDYGSWGNAFFVRDCYPVALNLDGTIAYRLDPDDYTKKTDGTASDIFYELLSAAPSDWSTQWKQYYTKSGDEYILNDQGSAPTFAQDTYYKLTYSSSFTGNFMMAFPKVWFYRHEDSQYNYIEISDHKLSDDWKCYAHINASGQEVDFIYLPLFKGVIVNSKLRSLPGQIPQGNTTATDEVNAATALGSRWQIWDHSSVECLNDLLTLMSKSIDSQGRFGQGRSTGYNETDTATYGKLQTGTLIKKGKFRGYSATTKEVKVFGIEGFWANRWDRLQGILLVNNVWKIKMTPPYNFTGTDFVTLSNAAVPSEYGYLSKVQTSEYGSIPASIANGSSTKYFKDSFNKSATDTRVALRGNHCNTGDTAGFRCVHVDSAASVSHSSIGASPVYK